MSNELKKIFQIQEVLKETGYPDYQRISNEVLEFHNNTNTPLESIFSDLRKDIPWEYICGYAQFKGQFFKVTNETLIPRVETEQLVDKAIELLSSTSFKTVIDVGTGSGCIAISVSKFVEKNTKLFATDISKDAIEIAKLNATNNSAENIQFIHTDLIQDVDIEQPVLILANLPYIPTKQYEELDPCVIDNEPRLALDGGKSGLDLYKKLFEQIKRKKINSAQILCEIEPTTLENFRELINKSFNVPGDIIKDYQRLDRFVLVSLS